MNKIKLLLPTSMLPGQKLKAFNFPSYQKKNIYIYIIEAPSDRA